MDVKQIVDLEKLQLIIVRKLKEEFDMLHEEIVRMLKNKNNGQMNICGELIKVQLSLAAQIIREERDLNGKGAYAFPPYTPR